MNTIAKEILIKAKKEVFTGRLGDFVTTFKGEGLDFREIRDYDFNDDIKKINWKASAKGQGLKVNEFNEERELNIVIVFLMNGSLHFGTVDLKRYIASEIMTILGYSSLRQKNKLQTILYSNEEQIHIRPSKKESVILESLEYSVEKDFLGLSVNYKELIQYISQYVKEKSLIFFIGDFLEPVDFSEINSKHEVYNIIVRDKFEEEPKLFGELNLIDPTVFEKEEFLFDNNTIDKYIKEMKKIDNHNIENFIHNNIKYGKIYTNDNVFIKLSEILKG